MNIVTPQEKARVAVTLLENAIIEILSQQPGLNTTQIGSLLEISNLLEGKQEGWVQYIILRRLRDQKLVRNERRGNRDCWYLA